jgi:diguanylate cyclase (GGDEF)-like protein
MTREGMGQLIGLQTLTAAANVALALSILALTLSSLRRGRPSHGRSWLFFAVASGTLVLHALLEAIPGSPPEVTAIFEVATLALLGAGFVYLYGADREAMHDLQTAAERDAMTQLYNLRTFRILTEARLTAAGPESAIAIAVIDLDGFKQVNETSGHPAGDRALGLVATAVRASLRTSDIAGRYGGDEFILLLDRCDDDAAARIVGRIRNTVQALSSAAGQPLSFSAGLASYPACGRTFDALVERADEALFVAKRAGKDGIRSALAVHRV